MDRETFLSMARISPSTEEKLGPRYTVPGSPYDWRQCPACEGVGHEVDADGEPVELCEVCEEEVVIDVPPADGVGHTYRVSVVMSPVALVWFAGQSVDKRVVLDGPWPDDQRAPEPPL